MNRIRLASVMSLLFLVGCASQLPNNTALPSYALPPSTHGKLAEYVSKQNTFATQNAVHPLGLGTDAYVARLYLVEQATTSIDLQYYIYRSDVTGLQLSYSLWQAAERGVRVRLLLDDLSTNRNDEHLHLLASHRNIDVRLFNPFVHSNAKALDFASNFNRLNRRMHNKSMTIDSLFSIVGGRNIGDEYFSASRDKEFGDFDLLAVGPVVSDTSQQFDEYWNHPLSYALSTLEQKTLSPKQQSQQLAQWQTQISASISNHQHYINALQNARLANYITHNNLPWHVGSAELIYDNPDKIIGLATDNLLTKLTRQIATTTQNIIIISPYFVPRQRGTEQLIELATRGINITIVTNSLAATDVVAVHSGYAPYRHDLLAAGIKLFEMKVSPNAKPDAWRASSQASLHAKSVLFDDHTIFVGSFNLDPRSVYLNTEMGILFSNQEFVKDIAQNLHTVLQQNCYQLKLDQEQQVYWFDLANKTTINSEPDASIWRKIAAWFFELLPIEEQL